MKRTKLITNLCLLVLTIACLTFGVYSAVKTSFTASGTITFNNYGIDADVQIDIYGVENGTTVTSSDENYAAVTGLKKRTVQATTTESRKTTDKTLLSSSTTLSLGELKFDELNTTVVEEWRAKIVLVISFTNYSKFDAQLSVTQEAAAITNLTATYGSKIKATKSTNGTTGVKSTLSLTITLTPTDTSTEVSGIFNAHITLQPVKAEKGDLITMSLEGASSNRHYRVLKVDKNNSNIVEVIAMYDLETGQQFDASGSSNYSDSSLDVYLTNWYNFSLMDVARNAIVENNITQYSYTSDDSVYDATTHASEADYSSKSVVYQNDDKTVTTLTRNIYALDVEDIYEYFKKTDGTYSFSAADIWKLFWDTETEPSTKRNVWLRSAASIEGSQIVWCIGSILGCDSVSSYRCVRPAFKIDLSKVDWA